MDYSCKLCKYISKIKYSYDQHIMSQKHIENEIFNLYCDQCNKKFDDIRKIKSHRYNVHIRDINKKNKPNDTNSQDNTQNNDINKVVVNEIKEINKNTKIIQEDVTEVKEEVIEVKEEVSDVKHEIIGVKKEVKKAINTAKKLIKIIMENNSNVPAITMATNQKCLKAIELIFKPLTNLEIESEDEYRLERRLVYEFYKNRLINTLFKVVLVLVKYKDGGNQNVYNSDSARNNYIIKVNNWEADAAGLKFTKFIIKPLLQSLEKLVLKYIEYIEDRGPKKYKTFYDMDYMTHLYSASLLCTHIEKDELIKPLLNKLSPYLKYFNNELESFNISDVQKELEKIMDEDELCNQDLRKKYRSRASFYKPKSKSKEDYTSDDDDDDDDINNKIAYKPKKKMK